MPCAGLRPRRAAMLRGMGFCLSHISALEYWRSLDAFDSSLLLAGGASSRTAVPHPSAGGVISCREIADEVLAGAGPLSEPVHILVPSKDCRRTTDVLVFHVRANPVPRNSLYALSKGGFVASPELTFVQCAASESLFDLMRIGAELTGSYGIVVDRSQYEDAFCGFVKRERLSSVARMQAFLARVPGDRGLRKARRALRYIPENCASPMEAALALLLHLPRSLGGYGLPKPHMNYRIDMRRGDWKASGKPYYVCDLYWPDAGLCVEYDSTMFHTQRERIASDSKRRNALAFRGVSVVSVTAKQMFDRGELDKVAFLLAKMLGVRLSLSAPEFRSRQQALRTALLFEGDVGVRNRR